MGETNDQAQVYDWTDPAPQFLGEAYSVGNGQPLFGNLNFKDFEYNSSFTEGLSAATSNMVPPTGGLLLAEEGLGINWSIKKLTVPCHSKHLNNTLSIQY